MEILHVRRAILTDTICAPAAFSSTFGGRLRRLTLTAPSINFSAIPALLMTFTNLKSLEITGYVYEAIDVPLDEFVARCSGSRRRFPGTPGFAPLHSLILRPSYSVSYSIPPDHIIQIVTLLCALAPTLAHLQLSAHFGESAVLLPLLTDGFDALERVWIGFLGAQDEIGEGVRLNVGDDRRCRQGAMRGGFADAEPLPAGHVDANGWEPQLTEEQAASLNLRPANFTEQAVLARLRLDEDIPRRLVDPHLQPPWPPSSLPFRQLFNLLSPFPQYASLFSRPRARSLLALWVFETEYGPARGPRRREDGKSG